MGGGLDIGLRYRGRVILKLGLKCLKNRKAKRENYVNKEGRKKGKGKGDWGKVIRKWWEKSKGKWEKLEREGLKEK